MSNIGWEKEKSEKQYLCYFETTTVHQPIIAVLSSFTCGKTLLGTVGSTFDASTYTTNSISANIIAPRKNIPFMQNTPILQVCPLPKQINLYIPIKYMSVLCQQHLCTFSDIGDFLLVAYSSILISEDDIKYFMERFSN